MCPQSDYSIVTKQVGYTGALRHGTQRGQSCGRPVDDAKRDSLRTRAYVTAALLCFIFAVVYTNTLFQTP